jgi:predicted RNA-binding protein with RPS1 domain
MSDELNTTASVETPEAPEVEALAETPASPEAEAAPEAPVAAAEEAAEAETAPEAPVAAAAEPPAAEEATVATVEEISAVEESPEAPLAAAEETPAGISAPVAEGDTAEAPVALSTPRSIGEVTPGMEIAGKVKRIELFGAFVDIGVGKDGLLHISQLGKPDVRNVEDVVQVGQTLTVYVLKVDQEQGRIALSLTKPVGMPWDALRQGMEVTGTVIKLETYGVFVDFGAERPGMVHVSELASGYVKSPADVVKVGDVVSAQIIKLDKRKKRIDLSVKAMSEKEEVVSRQDLREEPQEDLPTAMELALRRAMGTDAPYDRKKSDRERDQRRSRKHERDREDIYERTLRNHRG